MMRYLNLLSIVIPCIVTGFSPIQPHHRGTAWLTRKGPTIGTTQLYAIDEKAVADSVQVLQKSIVEKPTVVNVLPADKVVTKSISTPPPPPPPAPVVAEVPPPAPVVADVPPPPPVETITPPPPPVETVEAVVAVPPPETVVSVPDVSVVVPPPEVTATVVPDVVPDAASSALSLPSVDLPSVDLPDASAILDSLPVGDLPILAIVGVVVVAVIAAVLSLGKGDEPSAEAAAAPAVATTVAEAVAAPAASTTDSDTVDLSVPYDAAARLAYDEWRAANNKGSFDAAKFATFQTNYELVTVANVSAKDKARKSGEAPSLQSLGADADTTIVTLSTVA